MLLRISKLRIPKLRILPLRISRARFFPLLLVCAAAGPARAQQLIGYVNTRDAETTGASDVLSGQAVLTGSVGVTAKDHTAPITLGRGGAVRVCQTSVVHLTESKGAAIPAPLLFSLDRGAIEIQTDSTPNDTIMTPDLRFTVHNSGPLDVRMRVARNGDTCVENRGAGAPTLAASDPFGEAIYEVGPGQHLMFEHGSLREVVDNERTPCGCPDEKGVSLADALLAPPGAKLGGKSADAVPMAPPVPVAPPAPVAVAAPAPVPPATNEPAVVSAAPVTAAPVSPAPAAKQTTAVAAVPAVQAAAPVAAAVPANAPAATGVQPAPTVAAPAVAAAPATVDQAAAEQAAQRAVEQAAAEAAARAAALHPFPAAVSEGLVPPDEVAAAATPAAGVSYDAPALALSAPAAAPVPPTPVQPAAAKPAPHGVGHAIGRFFRRLFGGS